MGCWVSNVIVWLTLLPVMACPPSARAADEPVIPPPRGFVNDFAGVIDPATAAHLEALIAELRAKTGAEIAVVTVKSTQPLSDFDYAMKIAEQWKPGAAGKDNGVVFLTAVRDRRMFILTGYGIEGALPDGRVGELRDRVILPRFRAGDIAGGIRAGTEEMAAIIAAEYGVTLNPEVISARSAPRKSQRPAPAYLVTLANLLILLAVLANWHALRRGRHRNRYVGLFGGSFGGGGFGGTGGGFGGFGGGSFGGGGAGGRW